MGCASYMLRPFFVLCETVTRQLKTWQDLTKMDQGSKEQLPRDCYHLYVLKHLFGC